MPSPTIPLEGAIAEIKRAKARNEIPDPRTNEHHAWNDALEIMTLESMDALRVMAGVEVG